MSGSPRTPPKRRAALDFLRSATLHFVNPAHYHRISDFGEFLTAHFLTIPNQRRTLYCATFVFETLYNAGEALVSKNNGLKCVTGSDFIVSDLNDTIDRFRDYRKKLNSKFFVYENEDALQVELT